MLGSAPPLGGATSYRSTAPLVPPQRVYQAVAAFSPAFRSSRPRQRLEELAWPPPTPPYPPRPPLELLRPRSRGVRGCNLVRPCTMASEVTRMLLFNASSAVLSVLGALLTWHGAVLAFVTLPLCGLGVAVFHTLLQTVFYLCCADAFIYNALAASAADCIDMDTVRWGLDESEADERHPLLPIRVPPPPGAHGERLMEPCPRFESSLGTTSPRCVLALVYFGSFKLLVGMSQFVVLALVLGVLGFLIGDDRVPIALTARANLHPFVMYTAAFVLLLVGLALLHGVTRVSKRVTLFFCCEAVGPSQ